MAIRKNFIIMLTLALLSANTNAAEIKELVAEALKTGKSEGTLPSSVSQVFGRFTNSNEPVEMRLTKVMTFQGGCGRLRFEMKQPYAQNEDGKSPPAVTPKFELNLCPDGNPPIEAINAEKEKTDKELACHVAIIKGNKEKTTGKQHGTIIASGCPAGGMSHWRYEGECEPLKMPKYQVTNTPIANNGKIYIELLIPFQCQSKKNVWTAWMTESTNSQPIGLFRAQW